MTKDNRNLDKSKDEALLQEIINDDTPIPEDTDPADHDGEVDESEIDPHMPKETEETEQEDVSEEPEEPDYKEKFSQSSREATNLYFKNKTITDTVDKAFALPDPTEMELKGYATLQGAVWDELDDLSQNILKKTLINEKKFDMIHSATTANKKLDEWADEVDAFANSPSTLAKYPSMSDHEVEFKKYCMKEARRGMDMTDLVASFLFNAQGDDPIPNKKGKKKSMLLSGGGGRDSSPKPAQLTAQDVRVIREKDPRRYERLVRDGKLGLDLLDLD